MRRDETEVRIVDVLPALFPVKTFTVGKVFNTTGRIPQYHWEKFKEFLQGAGGKRVRLSGIPEISCREIKQGDTDEKLMGETGGLMSEELFWSVLYLLIINQTTGERMLGYKLDTEKEYILHVFVNNGRLSVSVSFESDGWNFNCHAFDGNKYSGEGKIYLYTKY